jgi:hypothetical protein
VNSAVCGGDGWREISPHSSRTLSIDNRGKANSNNNIENAGANVNNVASNGDARHANATANQQTTAKNSPSTTVRTVHCNAS